MDYKWSLPDFLKSSKAEKYYDPDFDPSTLQVKSFEAAPIKEELSKEEFAAKMIEKYGEC